MFKRTLASFSPTVYKNVVEMDKLLEAEEKVMDIARQEAYAAFSNTFVLTADEDGVIMFEKVLGITADSTTESLEFRRGRILNRMSMSPPFTFRFLKQKLDTIIGEGKWTAYIDFDNYTIFVEYSAINANWYTELEFTMTQLKPCNMVFTNVPRCTDFINISEEISYDVQEYTYLLGTWKLGEKPFVTKYEGGVLKLPSTSSIKQKLLDDVAAWLSWDEIGSVRLNDTILVPQFTMTRNDSTVLIEYEVTPKICSTIKKIELIDSKGTILSSAVVYVPVSTTVICKNTITVKEGV